LFNTSIWRYVHLTIFNIVKIESEVSKIWRKLNTSEPSHEKPQKKLSFSWTKYVKE